MYYAIQVNTHTRNTHAMQHPNKILLYIACICVTAHLLILITMFFASGYNWISYLMIDYEWFAGTVTVLLLIEHSVWLHLLWNLAQPPYYSLGLAFLGVLVCITSWVMEIVVPTVPDPKNLHPWFCIFFIVGCALNIAGSALLLPGRSHGVDASYKYIFIALGASAVLMSGVWFVWWMIKASFNSTWHIEQTFQIVAYSTYLAALGVVFNWFSMN